MRSVAVILLVLCAGALEAAVGDFAPEVPLALRQNTGRTRSNLGAPPAADLDKDWAARPSGYGGTNGAHYIWDAADAMASSTAPTTYTDWIGGRYLLIAYMAEARHSGPRTATYLTKIKSIANNMSGANATIGGWFAALTYDWIHNDLDSGTLTALRTWMYPIMSTYEATRIGDSPYNDVYYISGYVVPHFIMALAIYPDDAATSLPHLRWTLDMHLRNLFPIWKHVMGNLGKCGASSDSDPDCGGGWHEEWGGYMNQVTGITHVYVPYLLAWANASNDMAYFTREGWIKNFAYYTMYMMRPDARTDLLGRGAYGVMDGEYSNGLTFPASISGLGEIYDDPTIRGWSRTFNSARADGFDPSAWPYFTPDNSATKTANTRAPLAKVKHFPGWGTIFFRTGWGEDDTECSLKYGDWFWSQAVQDSGAFTCFNRAPLVVRSGTYRAGTGSAHLLYAAQAISQNTITLTDPADTYSDENFTVWRKSVSTSEPYPNDGGQRRVGSGMGNALGGTGEMQQAQHNPLDVGQWMRSQELYRAGTLLAYKVAAKYTYVAMELRDAYNNAYSTAAHTGAGKLREANTSNRTNRVSSHVRHFVWIPRGTSAIVLVFDRVLSTNSTFVKKSLIHTVNQPTTATYSGGTRWTATRAELITGVNNGGSWPYPQSLAGFITHNVGNFQYQYAGKVYGWLTLPVTHTVTLVGGPGHEFDIAGVNYKDCLVGQCPGAEFGGTDDEINPDVARWTGDFGSWRIEESPSAGALEDFFLNVMLLTDTGDTNVISTEPVTSSSGANWVTTFKDSANACAYTITLPKVGVGMTITAAGSCPGGTIS